MRRATNRAVMGVMLAGTMLTAGQIGHSQALDRVMREKLEHAQQILAAIVVEDFETVEAEARALARLTEASAWSVFRTPEYKGHSADFLRASEALVEAARQRTIDGAALEYVNLTLKCVQCHKYVRGARVAGRPYLPESTVEGQERQEVPTP